MIWIAAAYLAIGIAVMATTQDREQDGWLWTVLLWTLQLIATH